MSIIGQEERGAAEDGYDCADCGACCRCYPIFALEADAAREPRIKDEGVYCDDFLRQGLVAYRIFPLARKDGCAFLQANQLCSIYETRPEACRKLEPGSRQCVEARRRVGVGKART